MRLGSYRSRVSALCISWVVLAVAWEAAAEQVAEKTWDTEISTKDSVDKTGAIAVGDHGDGKYIYIAGSTLAFRGSNTSLEALVENNPKDGKGYDASEKYSDAFVAKMAKDTRNIVWVHRLQASGAHGRHKTRYYGIYYHAAGDLVYAVGQKMNPETRIYNAHISVLEAKTGKAVSSTTYFEESTAASRFQSVVRKGSEIYVCGNDASEGKLKHVQEGGYWGGLVVMRVATDGKKIWGRKTGADRLLDRCNGIAVSEDGEGVFVSGTVFKKAKEGSQSGKPMGHIFVTKLAASIGDMVWEKTIPQAATENSNAGGLVYAIDSLFVSFTKWTDVYRGSRSMLAKLSAKTGMILFSRETCCKEVIPQLPSGTYKGKGSSLASTGLHLGEDHYLYQLVSMRARQKSSPDSYVARVVRTSIFGDQEGSDFSSPLDKYKFDAMRPIGFVALEKGAGIFAVQRSGDMTGSDEEAWQTKVFQIKELRAKEAGSADYLPSSGKFYAKIQVKLSSVPKTQASREKIIEAAAEVLRVHTSQVHLHIDPHDEDMILGATVFSDDAVENSKGANANNKDVRQALDRLHRSTVPQSSGFSHLETLAEVESGSLKRKTVPEVVKKGSYEKMAQAESASSSRSDPGPSKTSASSEKRSATKEEPKKGPKANIGLIVGGAIGGVVALAAIVGIAVFAARGRN